MKRLQMNVAFPEGYKLLRALDDAVKRSGIAPLYLELIKVRASQLNGCAYCLNKHISEAISFGEDPRRFYVLSAWREAPEWFSEEEKAILLITEEITNIGGHGVSDEVYNKAIALFGEDLTAKIIMAAIAINSLNRIAVGLSLHPTK